MNETQALWKRVNTEHCQNLWCDYSLHVLEECYKIDNKAVIFLFEISSSAEEPFTHYIDDKASFFCKRSTKKI